MHYHALPSGQAMPMLGLGTFRHSGRAGADAALKVGSEAHMAANIALFDWQLSARQIGCIDAIPTTNRVIDWWPGNFDQDD